MEQQSTRSKQFSLRSNSGFTIVEFMVASGLGLVILAISLSMFLTNRRLVRYDVQRTSLSQNLRSALDIMGMNIRLAGENLPPAFPAVEIIDGISGAPDELIIRRNIRDEVLKVCQTVADGSSDYLFFALSDLTPGCIYSDQAQNFSSWSTYRSEEGPEVSAYIYDPSTGTGEFFTYANEVDTGTTMYIELPSGDQWQNDYDPGLTAAYLLEEWHFSLVNDTLQMVIDNDDANPINIVFGLTDFQVQAELAGGTVVDEFAPPNQWPELQSVIISLSGEAATADQTLSRTLTSRFFPRNVLSN